MFFELFPVLPANAFYTFSGPAGEMPETPFQYSFSVLPTGIERVGKFNPGRHN